MRGYILKIVWEIFIYNLPHRNLVWNMNVENIMCNEKNIAGYDVEMKNVLSIFNTPKENILFKQCLAKFGISYLN